MKATEHAQLVRDALNELYKQSDASNSDAVYKAVKELQETADREAVLRAALERILSHSEDMIASFHPDENLSNYNWIMQARAALVA